MTDDEWGLNDLKASACSIDLDNILTSASDTLDASTSVDKAEFPQDKSNDLDVIIPDISDTDASKPHTGSSSSRKFQKPKRSVSFNFKLDDPLYSDPSTFFDHDNHVSITDDAEREMDSKIALDDIESPVLPLALSIPPSSPSSDAAVHTDDSTPPNPIPHTTSPNFIPYATSPNHIPHITSPISEPSTKSSPSSPLIKSPSPPFSHSSSSRSTKPLHPKPATSPSAAAPPSEQGDLLVFLLDKVSGHHQQRIASIQKKLEQLRHDMEELHDGDSSDEDEPVIYDQVMRPDERALSPRLAHDTPPDRARLLRWVHLSGWVAALVLAALAAAAYLIHEDTRLMKRPGYS